MCRLGSDAIFLPPPLGQVGDEHDVVGQAKKETLPAVYGELIPVEERGPHEISRMGKRQIGPRGVKVLNPAFDITPNRYVTGIITERGVVRPPFKRELKKLY